MLKISLAATLILSGTIAFMSPSNASDGLYDAMTAAMGEAIEDPGYLEVLEKYGLPAPDFENDKSLVNSTDYTYPDTVEEGTLLSRMLETEQLRLGWIAEGKPWSVPGKDGDPVGLSVDYWNIINEKLNAHYGKNIKLDWVEFNIAVGNNDMYKWLATDDDQDCAALDTGSPENCYDVIGGAYAINERRKQISHMSPAYYPLNMAAVRTPAALKNENLELANAKEINAAVADPEAGLVFAGLEDTGEHSLMKQWHEKYGDTFTMVFRTPKSNVLEFAETTEANFVLGTNVRLLVTRNETPEFCSECEIIQSINNFGGVGFATALSVD